jgi:hypothetical protein
MQNMLDRPVWPKPQEAKTMRKTPLATCLPLAPVALALSALLGGCSIPAYQRPAARWPSSFRR